MTRRFLSPDPVHRRLAPLLVASFFGGVALWVPVEKLFLSEIGFSPQTIGLMAAAYAAAVPLLEIPSGILADRWSRRGVLAIGHVALLLSVLVGGLSTNVPTYMVAALLLGVYIAMQSGTFEAIVYDTVLEETGASDRFEALMGRVRVAESASLVLGALAGGVVAALASPRFTYFATIPFLATSLLGLAAFREPRLHQAGGSRSLRQHVGVTFGTLRREIRLVPVAVLLVLTSLLTQAVFEFGPLWLVDAEAGAGAFGPTWAALMASLGLGGALAGRVRFGNQRTLGMAAGVLVLATSSLLVARDVVVATAAQVVIAVTSVALGIFLTRVLHDAIDSDVRSGVASGVGAATWLTFLPFAVGFGAVTERSGVHAAGWLLVAVAALVAGLLAVVAAWPGIVGSPAAGPQVVGARAPAGAGIPAPDAAPVGADAVAA
jgi:predicted MFS family arabinose efflux permease